MSWLGTTALVAVLAAFAAPAVAQEAAAPPATAPPPVAAPAPATAGQAPAAPRAPVKDDEFIPSQELSADEQVTFPVDI